MPLLHFDALCITQPSGRKVFSFAAHANDLLQVADIPHMRRGENDVLEGYQRPEVAAHITEIRRYLESSDAVLPNTIVVAFDDSVVFEQIHLEAGNQASRSPSCYGQLVVSQPNGGNSKPGFVVDGQQRLAAASSSKHSDFPLFVTAFVAPDAAEQRKQFVLVNRTKPLPSGMVFELLAEIGGHLPQQLARQRLAATLTTRLNLAPGVLHGKIHTPTVPGGVIKDNSMRRAIANSLSDGALYELTHPQLYAKLEENLKTEEELLTVMQTLLTTFWESVAQVFPDAWKLPPKSSRLTHGVGIVALGYVMDYLFSRTLLSHEWNVERIRVELEELKPHCAWTSGSWKFGPEDVRGWNVLQNTDRDVRVLTSYLSRLVQERMEQASRQTKIEK